MPEIPCLLDYQHGLHLSIEGINYPKSNGIVILTFSSHCSHQLQSINCPILGLLENFWTQHMTTRCLTTPKKLWQFMTFHSLFLAHIHLQWCHPILHQKYVQLIVAFLLMWILHQAVSLIESTPQTSCQSNLKIRKSRAVNTPGPAIYVSHRMMWDFCLKLGPGKKLTETRAEEGKQQL